MMPAMSRSLLWLVPAIAVGVVARLWNIENQIVGGDELHAVRRSLTLPLSEILVTYHESDNCLPLTAIYRLWIDSGRPLTEMVLRVPVLLSGFALLFLAPWAAYRKFGVRVAGVLAWLLAISPLLINYSRTVRSYMPSVTLACLAVIAFMTWWRGGGRAWVLVYIFSAALAVYFHPLVASFVLAPGVFAALDLWFRREGRERPSLAALFATGLGLALALPAFYRGELKPGAVVESPWPSSWWMGRTAHLYQQQHGRRVLVTPVEAVLHDRRLAFRNYATNLDRAVSSGARYLIVHSNLPAEELRLPELSTPRGEMREGLVERMLSLSREIGRDAAARLGPPIFKDQRVRVWDLQAPE